MENLVEGLSLQDGEQDPSSRPAQGSGLVMQSVGWQMAMAHSYRVEVAEQPEEVAPFVDAIIVSQKLGELCVRVRNLSGQALDSVTLRFLMNEDVVGERAALFNGRLETCVTFTNECVVKPPAVAREKRKIPAQIWQTTGLKYVNPSIMGAIRSITDRNPGYGHSLVLDSECEDVIREHFEPQVLEAYRSLQAGAFKADLWRYCMLYVHGGVYIDCKMIAKQPLDKFVLPETDLVLVFSPMQCIRYMGFSPLYSAIIAAVPGHPYMKACVDATVHNVLSKKDTRGDLLGVTGPNMMFTTLKEMLREDPDQFKHLKIMEHTNNNSRKPHMFTVTEPASGEIVFYKQYPGYYEMVGADHYSSQGQASSLRVSL